MADLGQLIKLPKDFTHVVSTTTFDDLISEYKDPVVRLLVERFVSTSVRISFDPPTGSVLTALSDAKDTSANRLTMHSLPETS